MRKHKSVVAILLAVMMIFTFMPTMAFAAAGDQTWASDYSYCDIENSEGVVTRYNTVREFDSAGGMITATPTTAATAGGSPAGAVGNPISYYDLSNAYVAYGSTDMTKYETWQNSAIANNYDPDTKELGGVGLVLVQPDYTKGYTTAANAQKAWFDTTDSSIFLGFRVYDLHVYAEGFDPASYEPQTVTLHTVINPTWDDNYGEARAARLYKEVPDQIIKVTAKTPDPDDLCAWVDGKETQDALNGDVSVPYDAETHTLKTSEVPGFKVKYEVQDPTTKKYTEVESVEFKDAGIYHLKLTRWNTTKNVAVGNPVYRTFTVAALTNTLDYGFEDLKAGTTEVPATSTAKDFVKSGVKKADQEVAMAFFDKMFTLTEKVNKADSSIVTWTYEPITDAKAKAELAKEYKTFLTNYGADVDDFSAFGATVKLVNAPVVEKFDDITFTGVTTKAFKAKKKTKKLAKDKSFQVAATAASGNAVTFTATSSNGKVSIDATGKVTVKKGLKKGAKVKLVVKAHTAAGNGYKAASAEKTYTIKIK